VILVACSRTSTVSTARDNKLLIVSPATEGDVFPFGDLLFLNFIFWLGWWQRTGGLGHPTLVKVVSFSANHVALYSTNWCCGAEKYYFPNLRLCPMSQTHLRNFSLRICRLFLRLEFHVRFSHHGRSFGLDSQLRDRKKPQPARLSIPSGIMAGRGCYDCCELISIVDAAKCSRPLSCWQPCAWLPSVLCRMHRTH
jgi:hypothetical protein